QRTAGQVNESDHPAEVLEFAQHDLVDKQRRRYPEGNDIGQRIEFSSEWTLVTTEPGQPAIEQVENAGRENEPDGVVKIGGRLEKIGLLRAIIDSQHRGKSAEEVARRHQVRQ